MARLISILILFSYNFNLVYTSTPKESLTIADKENTTLNLNRDTIVLSILPLDTCVTNSIGRTCSSEQEFSVVIDQQSDCADLQFSWSINTNGFVQEEGEGQTFLYTINLDTSYEVIFIAKDTCDNETKASKLFTFSDCTAPSVELVSGIALNILPLAVTSLDLEGFISEKHDNCTDSIDLIHKLWLPWQGPRPTNSTEILQLSDPDIYGCNILGSHLVIIFTLDKQNNYAVDSSFLILSEINNDCVDNDPFGFVAGKILTVNGNGLDSVTIELSHPSFHQTISSSEGQYSFPVLEDESYTITPKKNNDILNGVTTFDVTLIRQHILGITPLEDPIAFLAADVNLSGTISTFDMVILIRIILGINQQFPEGETWRFIPAHFDFNTISNLKDIPSSITIDFNNPSLLSPDFIGIKRGDVNGNAIPR